MTAATQTPVRSRAERAASAAPLSTARLLWIELRHNTMPLLLPLIALLFWFDSYRPSTTQSPIWALTTFWNMGQGHTIIDFGPFVAGVAAWVGSKYLGSNAEALFSALKVGCMYCQRTPRFRVSL